jgi:hypothetical protein
MGILYVTMSTGTATGRGVVFRVLDAMDAPHNGRILRLRLQTGEAPPLRALRGAQLKATSPAGATARARVTGFALIGGKPSDERLARTGRVDVHVDKGDGQEPISLQWEVTLER